jgi:uncharacterized linocin/CFP29 family protein
MNHLLRQLAPISDEAWTALEDEAKSRLTTYLAARKLVDFNGPGGWAHSAYNLGRGAAVEGPAELVSASQRQVLPLVELRTEFTVSRSELDNVDRGATDIDFDDLDRAAKRIALVENRAVFGGYPHGGIKGIRPASSNTAITLDADYGKYPVSVSMAVNQLMENGIGGPYGLAIGPAGYTGIIETTEQGDLLLDHLRQILGGQVVWAPGVEGAIVLSLRGGDFVLDVGQDLSIGYLDHTAEAVRLYFEESLTFRVLQPDASVCLNQPGV